MAAKPLGKIIRKGRDDTLKRVCRVLFSVLSVCLVLFIFSNSLEAGADSAEKSGWVARFLKGIIDPGNKIDFAVFHLFIRKAAHFSEFAALGFSFMGLALTMRWRRSWSRFLVPGLAGLSVASADECIQIFTANRGPSVADVMLDFSGVIFGIGVMTVFWLLASALRRRT